MFLALASIVVGVSWMKHWYLYVLFTNLLMPLHIVIPQSFEPLWSLAVKARLSLMALCRLLSEHRGLTEVVYLPDCISPCNSWTDPSNTGLGSLELPRVVWTC